MTITLRKLPRGSTVDPRRNGRVIQGVCLDLDGTLYNRNTFWLLMILELGLAVIRRTISLNELRILYRIRQVTEKARDSGYRVGLATSIIDQVADETSSAKGRVVDILEKWTNRWQPNVLTGFKDTSLRHALTRLRLKGYQIGVYSDYPARYKLDALALPPTMFDSIVQSLDVNVSALKPDTRGFREVCKQLELDPTSVAYFGDRGDTDGKGAHAAGLSFVHCKPTFYFARHAPATRYLLELEEVAPVINMLPRAYALDRCWICTGSSLIKYASANIPLELNADMVKISDAHYGMTAPLLQCNDCGFIQAESKSVQQIEDLYSGLVDEEYDATSSARRIAFANLLKLIHQQRPLATKLLDVGAGTGGLCVEAQAMGFDSEGVEPSAWAVSKARRLGMRMHEGKFPHCSVKNKSFDIVTICDVIEHVSNPVDLLTAACSSVKQGGLIVIVTPDVDSLAARIMGRRWWHFRMGHVGYFNSKTMSLALTLAGLSVERKQYYVWRLPLSYLIRRVGTYLHMEKFVDHLLSIGFLKGLWNKKLPLNLFDSIIYFARPL